MLRFLEDHPFVRLVVPLMAGIVVADAGDGFCHIPYIYVLSVLILVGAMMCIAHMIHSWDRRALFGTLSLLFFFTVGFACCSWHWRKVQIAWPSAPQVYEGRLADGVTLKARSFLCPLHLTARWEGDTCRPLDTDILLYLPKDSAVAALKVGETVRFHGTVKSPTNFTPEFDYVRYLLHRHVTGTLYTRHWQVADTSSVGWRARALQEREKLLAYYRRTGVTGHEGAVLSALTLGYKNELSEEVRELYNVSGASHVLALSGLHIGILCTVLTFFLALFLPGGRCAHMRRLLVLPLVWGFVFMVGLPVSAIRAVVMFSLLMIGNSFTRVGFPLNTLALTAFGMLLYNPFYLFDVGFQMSFAAVASLLLLQPWFEGLLPRSRYAIVRYVWSLTTASLAAQIGVIPLILFYFSRFSPYALVVNLWVVPLTFVIVCLSVPFLLLSLLPLPALQEGVGWLLSRLIALMNGGLAWGNRLPGADVGHFPFSLPEVVCLYATLFFLFYGLVHRKKQAVVWVLACLCTGVFCRLFA